MKKIILTLLCFNLLLAASSGLSSLRLKGTVTAYGTAFSNFSSGGRFIPVIEGDFLPDTSRFIADFELSADSYARWDTVDQFTPGIKPYRAWIRWAGNQFELRAGLQKITFGKAQLLRTLAWFDNLDPRDPLGLTTGVFAERFRYYFPRSNANIWLWAVQEDLSSTSFYLPIEHEGLTLANQLGGRIELPLGDGEMGLSFNYKNVSADTVTVAGLAGPGIDLTLTNPLVKRFQYGVDGKWDREIGFWFEGAYVTERTDFDLMGGNAYMNTELAMLTLGTDYTIGLGNGLLVMAEYMGTAIRVEVDLGGGATHELNFLNFGGLMLSYPLGIFDSVGLMSFMDLDNLNVYAYMFWQRQWDNFTLRLSGALTDFDTGLEMFPGQAGSLSIGNMIQLMAIYDFKINVIKSR